MEEYTKSQPPRYFTSGSPKTCGNLWPPLIVVGPVGNWPPSTKVTPPSSEYANPEIEVVAVENPRKSLKAITTCCPVLSMAMEVSDCRSAAVKAASGQSGSFTHPPDCAPRPRFTESTCRFASLPVADKLLSMVLDGLSA